MTRVLSRRLLLSIPLAGLALPGRTQGRGRRLRVGFVNPGRSGDRFWQMAGGVMQAASRNFGIEIITAVAERDRSRIISLGREIVDQRPDYMIIVNEHRTVQPLLSAAIDAGIPSLVAFSGMTAEDTERLGRPRERSPLFLGTLLPDNAGAGAVMARALLAECRRLRPAGAAGSAPLLALGGLVATPAAQERFDGLQRALAADGRAELLDHVQVNWSREEARERALSLLRRQPGTQGVWCANDDMALGAMEAAVSLGWAPGRDLAVVGLNWQEDALREVAAGRLALSVGGHFLLGAWALAMLRDHADGWDFADAGGTSQHLTMAALDRDGVGPYLARYGGDGWMRLDFDRFRRHRGQYALDVGSMLTG